MTATGGRYVARVTLKTLADDLGVSRVTISNAFNRPDQLSTELRERILARAVELGFSGPDPLARGLRRGRAGAVGVLVDQGLSYAFADPAAVVQFDGLAAELSAGGCGLLLHSGEREHVDLVSAAAVDAWILASLPSDAPQVAAVQRSGRPFVVLDQPLLSAVPTVGIDDSAGTALAARHLLDLGHRRLSVLCTALRPDGHQGVADARRQSWATYSVSARRLDGVRREVEAAGGHWGDVPVIECARNDLDTGALATWELLDRSERPTAIVAFSDQLALGALRAAHELGVDVPGDLSVVGFDDAPPAATAEPPLTTVAQPLRERGRLAAALALALIRGEPVTSPPLLPVELVVRQTTARA
jgi:DNA-binding LacI/PurR family transcriptional regulator